MHVQREYEAQVAQLTGAVAAQEEASRRLQAEKHGVVQDLSAVRDLCTKLEATKDSLQRQLTARTLDQEKVWAILMQADKRRAFCRTPLQSETCALN